MDAVEIPEFKELLQGELLLVGEWVVAELDAAPSWPVTHQKISYLGRDFWLIPFTRESLPAVATQFQGENMRIAQSALLRFLSAVSWSENAGINVARYSGGRLPQVMRSDKRFNGAITQNLDLSYLPEPTDQRGRLALALMREGRGLNHPAYAFLSFYRVLEVAFPNGKDRGIWMQDAIDRLEYRRGQEAVKELKASGVANIAVHIQTERRQAIAHASSQPVVDPDDAEITEKLRSELPIARGLAELAIEEVVGIQTRHTQWREHLYELQGFKEAIGEEGIKRILENAPLAEGEGIELPEIDVELRQSAPFDSLKALKPVFADRRDGKLLARFKSDDDLIEFALLLDFPQERLIFEWSDGLSVFDDGSPQAALNAAEANRFMSDYLGNGQLRIYESGSRKLLSRVDAFIPVNFFSNPDAFLERINHWKAEACRRET